MMTADVLDRFVISHETDGNTFGKIKVRGNDIVVIDRRIQQYILLYKSKRKHVKPSYAGLLRSDCTRVNLTV